MSEKFKHKRISRSTHICESEKEKLKKITD